MSAAPHAIALSASRTPPQSETHQDQGPQSSPRHEDIRAHTAVGHHDAVLRIVDHVVQDAILGHHLPIHNPTSDSLPLGPIPRSRCSIAMLDLISSTPHHRHTFLAHTLTRIEPSASRELTVTRVQRLSLTLPALIVDDRITDASSLVASIVLPACKTPHGLDQHRAPQPTHHTSRITHRACRETAHTLRSAMPRNWRSASACLHQRHASDAAASRHSVRHFAGALRRV
eukprot:242818-Rhodomonas_salina.2